MNPQTTLKDFNKYQRPQKLWRLWAQTKIQFASKTQNNENKQTNKQTEMVIPRTGLTQQQILVLTIAVFLLSTSIMDKQLLRQKLVK